MSIETSRRAVSNTQTRGVLNSFLQHAALFTVLYVLIGNTYQQAYLRTFGVRASLIDPDHLLPVFSDIYVLLYVTLVWGILSRLPDRWYYHIAEIANLSTWRNEVEVLARIIGISFSYILFLVTNCIETQCLAKPSTLDTWFPSAAFFSRWETALVYLLVGPIIVFVYYLYMQIRRGGILEIVKEPRWFMWNIFQMGLPFCLIYAMTGFGLTIPATYGVHKAYVDMERMIGQPVQLVAQIEGIGAQCVDQSGTSNTFTYGGKDTYPEAHYMGLLGGFRFLVVFTGPSFGSTKICLLNATAIQYIELFSH